MNSSNHSRNSSSESGDNQIKPRERDDMLSRRLAGNLPAPLRKKKDENLSKKFITPTGNPMQYVKHHMRSKSLSDIQVENAELEEERDKRNSRYEEMEKLKEMLKEEEETWTSNLDSWKQRRRSATFDARKRKEDSEKVQQAAPSSYRRPKTYKEIVEEKKRRESAIEIVKSDDEDLFSSLPKTPDSTPVAEKTGVKKAPYRGAVSVPDFAASRSERRPSPTYVAEPATEPVKYTSRMTTVINHAPSNSGESNTASKPKESPRTAETKPDNSKRPVSRIGSIWPPPPSSDSPQSAPTPTKPLNTSPNKSYYAVPTQRRTQSPVQQAPRPKNPVELRNKNSRDSRERPKSAYGSIGGNRASTLPRNYNSYSAPKPFEPSVSEFVKNRKTTFASKRNMWENIGHQKQESAPSAPQHLSSLLKHDTGSLVGSDQPERPDSGSSNPSWSPLSEFQLRPTSAVESPRQNGVAPEQVDYKPQIRSPRNSSHSPPWQRFELGQDKPTEPKPIHKHVIAPVSRGAFSKSATLPSRAKIDLREDPVKTKPLEHATSPLQNGTEQDSRRSPRSPASDQSSQPEEMKICINQRPKSEKGFGFTVREGDDGRPVMVNTVSPGGAADICQLCVGDEILAINDVRLSPSISQDSIVQLIVGSVKTGNLSLDIRRYEKSKKPNPLRLSGTKVVMTSGGFVQVRSDKGKPPVVSTKAFNGSTSNVTDHKPPGIQQRLSTPSPLDLPPPPEDLQPPKRLSAVDRLSPKKPSPSTARRASPLSNLINAAKTTSPKSQDISHVKGKENEARSRIHASVTNHSSNAHEADDLESDVLKAQLDLEMEERYLSEERRNVENLNLKQKLMEEQRLLDEREAKREEEKRKRIEEAKAEEQRLEEELKKIEAAKLEQQKRREEEKRRLIESQTRFDPGYSRGNMNHWLIEEAERSRLAEDEGRQRTNVFNYNSNGNDLSIPNLPTQRSSSTQPHIPGSLANYWNDPNTRATLL